MFYVFCVEMEVVEVFQSLFYLVIGSISNYVDFFKNDEWKGYVVMMFVVYVKSVFFIIDSRQDQLGMYSLLVVFFEF